MNFEPSSPSTNSLTLAFDVDGTWDRDPDLWPALWTLAQVRGHKCIIVTGRQQPAEKMERLRIPRDAVVIVSGPMLKEEAALRAGYKVSVWIDDMPGMIQDCRILGGDLKPENDQIQP